MLHNGVNLDIIYWGQTNESSLDNPDPIKGVSAWES